LVRGNIEQAQNVISEYLNGISSINEMNKKISEFMETYSKTNREVLDDANTTKSISENIKIAADETKISIQDILKTVVDINDISQSNASISEEIFATTDNLSTMARNLLHEITFFNLDDEITDIDKKIEKKKK
jgi:methyl-accepting chemotaxis protein